MFAALRTQILTLFPLQTKSASLTIPAFVGKSFVKQAGLVVVASLLLALSAKIAVPFYPVPMTLQSLVVLLIGALCGARLGTLILACYILEGVLGLPVFAANSQVLGFTYLLGPTGGYLFGFLLAAAFVGFAAECGFTRGIVKAFITMSLGHGILFLAGFLWLTVLFGTAKAFAVGVLPFVAATVLKTVLAALLPQLSQVHFKAQP